MSRYLSQFTEATDVETTDYLAGYRTPAVGGSRRWSIATLLAKVFAADGVRCKFGEQALGSGVTTAAVEFDSVMSAAPTFVLPVVLAPDGSGAVLTAVPHTRTTAGFSVILSGPTPDANHKLLWLALA